MIGRRRWCPVLLYEMYRASGWVISAFVTRFTTSVIRGSRARRCCGPPALLDPAHFYDYDRLRDEFNPFALNLMKGGIVYANFVTTVSPQHAWEAQYTDQGRGLGHTLHVHGNKFGGVLNGVDYDLWNPEIDPLIPARYGSDWIDGKYVNKQALRERFLLGHEFKPVVASSGDWTARRAWT